MPKFEKYIGSEHMNDFAGNDKDKDVKDDVNKIDLIATKEYKNSDVKQNLPLWLQAILTICLWKNSSFWNKEKRLKEEKASL